MDKFQQSDALSEGRRIYVGNLLYSVTPTDLETMLAQTGLGNFDKIHISVDPVSGRNPGYCFVEFPTREDAELALSTLEGVSVYDRPLKVGPCHPKSSSSRDAKRSDGGGGRTHQPQYRPTFERWGDWNGQKGDMKPDKQGPYGAMKHVDETKARAAQNADDHRLYVGGLGRMIDQEQHDREMRELFDGFDIVAIGKRITPHPATRSKPGNHHYCFIHFASAEEAERARKATVGKAVDGGYLRVFPPRSKAPYKEDDLTAEDITLPLDANDRRAYQQQQQRRRQQSWQAGKGRDDARGREEQDGRQKVIMAASSWRVGSDSVGN